MRFDIPFGRYYKSYLILVIALMAVFSGTILNDGPYHGMNEKKQ
jgi:hypothetical protein